MPSASTQITVNDELFEELRRKIGSLKDARVKVGVLEAEGAGEPVEGSDITMAELMAIHEYGAPAANIPARAPLRLTFQEPAGREALVKFLERLGGAIIADKISPEQGLESLGLWAAAAIRRRIKERLEPPNKPATVKRKGSDVPLVDSGVLQASITHEVVTK